MKVRAWIGRRDGGPYRTSVELDTAEWRIARVPIGDELYLCCEVVATSPIPEDGVQVWASTPDGDVDITAGVRVLYDAVHASMDWGSGFLDTEEVAQIAAVADACGFAPLGDVATEYTDSGVVGDRDAYLRGLTARAAEVRALFAHLPKVKRRGW